MVNNSLFLPFERAIAPCLRCLIRRRRGADAKTHVEQKALEWSEMLPIQIDHPVLARSGARH